MSKNALLDLPPCRPCPLWDLLKKEGHEVHGAEWLPDQSEIVCVVGSPRWVAHSHAPHTSYVVRHSFPAWVTEPTNTMLRDVS